MLGLVLLAALPGQFPVIESKEFPAKLQETALAGTVYIHNKDTRADGSGAIIRVEKVFLYILTAGHVVKDGQNLVVGTFDRDTYPKPRFHTTVQVLAHSQGVRDLALLRVTTDTEKIGPAIPLYPPPREPKKLKVALTVGCDEGKPATCHVEKVLRAAPFSREANGERARLWELEKPQTPGRSGGPMLDEHGRLIGICSGNNRGEHGYFCHISEIERFLQDVPIDGRMLLREPKTKK